MPDEPSLTAPELQQVKLIIGEFAVTLARLETQRAALQAQVVTLTALVKPEATD